MSSPVEPTLRTRSGALRLTAATNLLVLITLGIELMITIDFKHTLESPNKCFFPCHNALGQLFCANFLTTILWTGPSVLIWPHFFNADLGYLMFLEGLKPNEAEHCFFFNIFEVRCDGNFTLHCNQTLDTFT